MGGVLGSRGTAHTEQPVTTFNGFVALIFGLVLLAIGGVCMWQAVGHFGVVWGTFSIGVIVILLGALTLAGLYTLQPNEAAILQLFGAYRGTSRVAGLRAANPFYTRKKLSLRARNLNGEKLKVNDKRGNPIEIGAVIVWRVEDTAKARFEVDDVDLYVKLQSEAALRHVASLYAYDEADSQDAEEITLRGGLDDVAQALAAELSARFASAGVLVSDARLTHLAYAPEIAQVMLRRQQAEAVISARHKIVQGAVAMVESALTALSERNVVTLDDERKAAMVSNLLVVLCGDNEAQPIINAGTLYS